MLKDRRGQTLIEAIVASGIILTAVASALTLVSSSLNAEKESEALITAGNIAREGIEVVRAIRDSNWLAGDAFDAGLSGLSDDYTGVPQFLALNKSWVFDFVPNDISDDGARIYRYTQVSGNSAEGLLVQAPAQPANTAITQWKRLLTLNALCDDGIGGYTVVTSGASCGAAEKIGIQAISSVEWNVGERQKALQMEEIIMDWR